MGPSSRKRRLNKQEQGKWSYKQTKQKTTQTQTKAMLPNQCNVSGSNENKNAETGEDKKPNILHNF